MTALGTVTRVISPPVNVITEKITTGVFLQKHIGIRYISTPVTRLYVLDPKAPIIPPTVGQIWPRGMVGPYRGVRVIGTARLYYLNQTDKAPISNIGQLWPRGDFIPSEND